MTALSMAFLTTPFVASAKSFEEAYVESYHGRSDIPVPTAVVSPQVGTEDVGVAVELVFVVDESGKPNEIEVRNDVDRRLAKLVVNAVKKWEFAPLVDAAGEPVASKVMLPVHIVDEFSSELLVAAN